MKLLLLLSLVLRPPLGLDLLYAGAMPVPEPKPHLELWRVSVRTGQQSLIGKYPGDEGTLRAARISPDGRKLGYTFGGTTNEVWELENFLPKASADK